MLVLTRGHTNLLCLVYILHLSRIYIYIHPHIHYSGGNALIHNNYVPKITINIPHRIISKLFHKIVIYSLLLLTQIGIIHVTIINNTLLWS